MKPASRHRLRPNPRRSRRSPLILLLLLLLWSVVMGLGLAQAATPSGSTTPTNTAPAHTAPVSTTDAVPARYQLGQEIYLETCASCHIGIPPAVMPTQTWQQILPDPQHYGVQITPLTEPSLHIAWNYIQVYSRPTGKGESVPYRLAQSRYFKALHPKVQFPQPVSLGTCVSCHPGAAQFNYRSLTPEWQNAP